ncbi:MAG: hypothetical protein HQL90_04545 [Magnetococcales bacterium]|nr:hypothetical protein [Magnetococcales bacterium]
MISVQVGGTPDLVRQGRARHKLFVEGGGGDVIDFEFLKIFLPMIDIEVMGASFHLKSVATALHPYHPDYYFLIDRDHHDDQTVNNSWQKFPDPDTSNLLIWKKKEIENYFLDIDYLQRSNWIKSTYKGSEGRKKLEAKIQKIATDRIYMEVANSVILTIREEQKRTWIEIFSNPSQFTSIETSINMLLGRNEFQERAEVVADSVHGDNIRRMFNKTFDEMSGGSIPLDLNRGTWLARMSGKEILTQIVSNCFQVRGRDGKPVQGGTQYIEVIKDLARQELQNQPYDFKELYGLIDSRTRGP